MPISNEEVVQVQQLYVGPLANEVVAVQQHVGPLGAEIPLLPQDQQQHGG